MMPRLVAKFGLGLIAALAGPAAAAAAQAPSEIAGPESATVRMGVLAIDPRFSVGDVGVDTNVFASPDNPQRDVTATASVGGNIWLRTGRGLLMITSDSEYVHYDKFVGERAAGTEASAHYEVRMNRIKPFVRAGLSRRRKRPNDEITLRVRQSSAGFGGGADFRILSRSIARAEWRRERTDFADDARFGGHDLKTQLNRTVDSVDLSWRQRLTALTTFVTRVSHSRDQFAFQPVRDSENYRLNAGFELAPLALIRGIVMVGYHDQRAAHPGALPEFSGVTANVDVAYTAPTQTRIQAVVERDLQQSYDPRTPTYTQFTWSGTLTQRVFGRWDVQLSGGRTRQGFLPAVDAAGRTDFMDRAGGAIGYAMASQVRAAFELNSLTRSSVEPLRRYSGVVAAFSVSYGY